MNKEKRDILDTLDYVQHSEPTISVGIINLKPVTFIGHKLYFTDP